MPQIITIKKAMERLASHSGLIHIGALLESIGTKKRFDHLESAQCLNPQFPHSAILSCMIALISIGKPDYDAIEIFRDKQDFFTKAIRINECPSSSTLCQRIDLIGK